MAVSVALMRILTKCPKDVPFKQGVNSAESSSRILQQVSKQQSPLAQCLRHPDPVCKRHRHTDHSCQRGMLFLQIEYREPSDSLQGFFHLRIAGRSNKLAGVQRRCQLTKGSLVFLIHATGPHDFRNAGKFQNLWIGTG